MAATTRDGADTLSELFIFLDEGKDHGAGWFNLRSSPGWGNTTFLRNLKNEIVASPSFRDTWVRFFPSLTEFEDDVIPVPELGPIGNTLYHLDPQRKLSGLSLWISRAKNTPGREWWLGFRKEIVLVVAFVCLLVLGIHLQTGGFWGWSIAAAVLATYVSNHLLQFKGLAGPELRKLESAQVNLYNNPKELVLRLDTASANAARIILLVDDLNCLPKRELSFLQNLVDQTRPLDAVRNLRERAAIRIVTLDPTGAVPVQKEVISRAMPEPDVHILDEVSSLKKARQKQVDLEANNLLAQFDTGNQGSWGLLELAAVCVTDLEDARTSQEWMALLSTVGDTSLKRHLEAAGLHLEGAPGSLLSGLRRTPLFRASGKFYYRDRWVAASLRKLMEEQYRLVVLHARLFWLTYWEHQTQKEVGSSLFRHAVEVARWPEESIRIVGIEPLLAPLIHGARLWRENGEVHLSSEALQLGRGLLAHAGSTSEIIAALAGKFAAEWALLYSWTAFPQQDRHTAEANGPQILVTHPVWAVHLRQIEEVADAASPVLLSDTGMSAEIQNLNRSVYTDGRVRVLVLLGHKNNIL